MPFLPITWDERRMASVVPPSFAAQNRALVFPITGDDPSAHFLAAAPGRTPQRLTDRLAAGDRSSLGQAFSAELPVQSILTLHLYHIPPELARENCKKTQKGRTRRARPRLSKGLAEFAARRPRIVFNLFFAAACTSRKILCAERVCFHAFHA